MNKTQLLLSFLIGFYVLPIVGQSAKASNGDKGETLKVMTYNIWNGFDWGKDKDRHTKTVAWIASQKADVVALQELCGYTEEKLRTDAKSWGHDYAVILKEDGYPVGITSNKPIKIKDKLREDMWHGMLLCETWGVDFYVVHLSPADRDFRYKETGIIKEKIKHSENENFIVLGDFNAHSPFDDDQDMVDDFQLQRTRKGQLENKKGHKNLLDNEIDYSVISSFMATPLIDVTQRFVAAKERFTFPAKGLIGIWLTAEEVEKSKHRLDYILTSRSMAKNCTNALVPNGEDTAMLSDHYPVIAEFMINE